MSVQSRLVVKVYLITIQHKNKSLLYHATGSTVYLLFGFLFKDPNDKRLSSMLSVLSDKHVVFIRFVQRSGLRVIARPSQSKVCLQFVLVSSAVEKVKLQYVGQPAVFVSRGGRSAVKNKFINKVIITNNLSFLSSRNKNFIFNVLFFFFFSVPREWVS